MSLSSRNRRFGAGIESLEHVRWLGTSNRSDEGGDMRTMVLGTFAAAGLLFGLPAVSATQPGAGLRGGANDEGLVQPVQSRHCDELRRACLNKNRLGERGEGNCARYRSECRGVRGYRPIDRWYQ